MRTPAEEADVIINVKSVKEKVLAELDDEFAQLASEFDTLEELEEQHPRAGPPQQS